MTKKRRGRRMPADPAEIARRREERRGQERARLNNPSSWGEEPVSKSAAALMEAKGVELHLDGARRITRAMRGDVFWIMYRRGVLTEQQHRAVVRFERDIATRAGINVDDERRVFDFDVVDNTAEPGAVTQAMIEGGRRMTDALKVMAKRKGEKIEGAIGIVNGVTLGAILRGLLEPPIWEGRAVDWRAVVKSASGCDQRNLQSVYIRQAASALMAAYEQIDNPPKQRATIAPARNNEKALSDAAKAA